MVSYSRRKIISQTLKQETIQRKLTQIRPRPGQSDPEPVQLLGLVQLGGRRRRRLLEPLAGHGNTDRDGIVLLLLLLLASRDPDVVHRLLLMQLLTLRGLRFELDDRGQGRAAAAAGLEVVRCGHLGHLARFAFNLEGELMKRWWGEGR